MDTWKKYLIVTVILMSLVVFFTLAAVNFAGIGDKLSGVGGPFTTGAFKLGLGPLTWAQSGGYQMLVFYIINPLIISLMVAYVVWHFDLGYKLTGAVASSSPAAGYDNTMKREPEEPERSNTPITK